MNLLQDVLYALRLLRKHFWFTTIVVTTLGLGLGANIAIFTVTNAALLRPLAYRDPERLVRMFETYRPNGLGTVAPANFLDWRNQDIFAAMASYRTGSRNIQGKGPPEHVTCVMASANLFDLLGAPARIGRTFAAKEDEIGKAGVAIISDELWKRDFGERDEAVGQTVYVDEHPYNIIGVMPTGFRFPPNTRTDLWLPLQLSPGQATVRDTHYLSVIARLKYDVSLAEASAQMQAVVSRLATAYPKELEGRGVKLVGLHEYLVSDARPKLKALMAAVLLVLVIASANTTNLLLARSARRTREVSIRVAIGASPTRLLRQFFTESIVLTFLGAAAAFVIGLTGLRMMGGWANRALPYLQNLRIDWRVAAFVALLGLGTATLFGIVPALRALRTDIQGELRNDLTSYRQSRTRKSLVIGEVAFSMMLVIGTVLLARSFVRLLNVRTGCDTKNVITMHLSAQPGMYKSGEEVNRLYEPVLDRIRHLPGVKAASLTSLLPLQDWGTNGTFQIKGHPALAGQEPSAEMRIVSDDYFKALGIPLISGRFFSPADIATSTNVVIVNDALAEKYFPKQDALGQMLERDTLSIIVGVVGNVRQLGLDQQAVPELYYPDTQAAAGNWFLGDVVLVVKSEIDPRALVSQIRSTVQEIKTDEAVFDIETMDEVVSTSLFDRKTFLTLWSVFSVLALGLSVIGLYGLMSYEVSQRTREFGIRMALGADNRQMFWLIFSESARLVGSGILFGFVPTLVAMRYLRSVLFGVAPADVLTLVLSIAIITIVGLVAGILPAIRAAKTAPMSALRYE